MVYNVLVSFSCALETCCAGGSPLCVALIRSLAAVTLFPSMSNSFRALATIIPWLWVLLPKRALAVGRSVKTPAPDDAPERSEKYSTPFSALRWWSGCRQCRAHAVIWTTGRVHLRLSMSKRHHLRPPTSFAGYTALQWHDRQSRAVAQRLDFGLPHAWYCHRAPGGRRASRRRMLRCQQSCTSPRAPLHSCPGACV